jgi:hypothetical protein
MSKLSLFSLLKTTVCASLLLAISVGSVQAVACTLGGTEGTQTLSGTSCTFTENVVGADGGIVDVAASTSLTINDGQTLAYTTRINLGANSTIVLSKTGAGGKIRKGYIYVTDADGDGYRLNSATDAVFSTTAVPGKVRRSTVSSTLDANDGQACASGSTAYTCNTCVNGARVAVANGADTLNHCASAGWNGCVNLCQKSTTNTGNCNGSGSCATSTQNVAAGMICSSGSETAGACSPGYTCNGSGQCSYTDIYGEHILW